MNRLTETQRVLDNARKEREEAGHELDNAHASIKYADRRVENARRALRHARVCEAGPKLAEALRSIWSLLDDVLAESGVELSSGQRKVQRAAFELLDSLKDES